MSWRSYIVPVVIVCTALSSTLAWAQQSGQSVEDLFAQTIANEQQGRADVMGGALESDEKADSAANSDGLGGAASKLDIAKRLFVAFDLGELGKEDGKVVFNFNPDLLKVGIGQTSLRFTAYEASVHSAVSSAIDDAADDSLDGLAEELAAGLSDFDDWEFQVGWTNDSADDDATQADQRRASIGAATFRAAARAEFAAMTASADPSARALAERAESRSAADLTPQDVRALTSRARALSDGALAEVRALSDPIARRGIDAVSQLVANKSTWSVSAAARQRSGAAGPDEVTASVRYEWGLQTVESLAGVDTARSLMQQVDAFAWFERAPRLAFSGEVKRVRAFRYAVSGTEVLVDAPEIDKYGLSATYGQLLSINHRSRFDLEAKYDHADDDPSLQSRFIATATWTQGLNKTVEKLVGGTSLSVSLVWANKPEFRGEVDEELSLRTGLKWSVDKGKR